MPYEVADWKSAKVQYNYHVSVLGMYYSVPYEYIHKTVEIRITQSAVQIFYDHKRIASHLRLYGPKGQYSTCKMHMPENHRKYLEWDALVSTAGLKASALMQLMSSKASCVRIPSSNRATAVAWGSYTLLKNIVPPAWNPLVPRR